MALHRDLVEASRWVEQAAYDLQLSEDIGERYPSIACFHAQQAAEKALKGVAVALWGNYPREHSVRDLLESLPEVAAVLEKPERTFRLDRYYNQTRYPDSLPGRSIPAKHFTTADVEEAVTLAREVVTAAEGLLRNLAGERPERPFPYRRGTELRS